MPQLIISVEHEFPTVHDLDADFISIGRLEENDLCIPFDFISSVHAQLAREPNGQYRLTDENSHNGTFVNGNRLGSALLESGDQIAFGPALATYLVGEAKEDTGYIKSSVSKKPVTSETAPVALGEDGAPAAVSEVELQIQLRDKIQKEIAEEFENEKRHIDELKKIAADLEEENSQTRGRIDAARSEAENFEKEAAAHSSEMAMRQHLVRDLNQSREKEEEKVREAKTQLDEILTAQKRSEHELSVANKELDHVRKKVAEGKEAAERADVAFTNLIDYETKSVRIDTEIGSKEKALSELSHSVTEKERAVAKAQEELEGIQLEIEKLGGDRLSQLKEETREFANRIVEGKKSLDSLAFEKLEAQQQVQVAKSQLDDLQKEFARSNVAFEERKSELEAKHSEVEKLNKVLEETTPKVKDLEAEHQTLKKDVEKKRKENDKLLSKVEEHRKLVESSGAEKKRLKELQEQSAQINRELDDRKAQLGTLDQDLAARQSKVSQAESGLEEARKTLEHINTVEIANLRNQADDLNNQTDGKRGELQDVQREIEKITAVRDEQRAAVEQQSEEINRLTEDRKRQAEEIDQLSTQKNDLEKERQSLDTALNNTRQTLDDLARETADRQKIADELAAERRTLDETRADISGLQKEIASRNEEIGKLDTVLSERESATKLFDKERSEHNAQIEEINRKKEDLEKERKSLETALINTRKTLDDLSRETADRQKIADELAAERRTLDETRAEITALQKEIASRKEEIGKHDAVLSEKESATKLFEEERKQHTAKIEKINAQKEAVGKELATVEADLAAARRNLKDTVAQTSDQKKISKQVDVELRMLEQHRSKNTALEKDIAGRREELERLDAVLAKQAADARAFESESKKRDAVLDKITSQIESLQNERKAVDDEIKTAGEKLKSVEEQIADARKREEEEKKRVTQSIESTKARKKEEDKAAKKVEVVLRELQVTRDAVTRAEADVSARKNGLTEIDLEIAGKRKVLRELEKSITNNKKALLKQERQSHSLLAAFIPRKSADTPGVSDSGSKESAALSTKEKDKLEDLKKQNEQISRLLAEKTAALDDAQKKLAAKQTEPAEPAKPEEPAKPRKSSAPPKIPQAAPEGEKQIRIDPKKKRHPTVAIAPLSSPRTPTNPRIASVDTPTADSGIVLDFIEDAADDETATKSKPAPASAPEPAAKAKPKSLTYHEKLAKAIPQSKPEPKPEPAAKAAPKPESKPEENPATKAAPIPTPAPAPKPKLDAEPKLKPAAKAAPAPEPKRKTKPEDKPVDHTPPPKQKQPESVPSKAKLGKSKLGGTPLCVVYPNCKEPSLSFPDGADAPDPDNHPPVGFVSLAACTGGIVCRAPENLPSGDFAALILLGGSLEKDQELIQRVSREANDKPILACWREGRLDKVAAKLQGGTAFQKFTEMLNGIDGLISLDGRTSSLLSELNLARHVLQIAIPCPVDAPQWDFSLPLSERKDAVFVSADGFDPDCQDHCLRLELVNSLANKHGLQVAVYHHIPDILDGLKIPADLLEELEPATGYKDYLSLVAKHRFVLGFGKNLAGADVWGDALLTGNIYIGSKAGMESALYPRTCLTNGDTRELEKNVIRLLADSSAYKISIQETLKRAHNQVSFEATRKRINSFLNSISEELLSIG